MIKFKQYAAYPRTKDGHIILNEPIHFRMGLPALKKTKEGHVIIDEPITFKHVKKSVAESVEHDKADAAHEYNKKHHGKVGDLSDKLHDATAHTLDDKESEHIKRYTGDDEHDDSQTGSSRLNRKLIHGQELTHSEKNMHNTIMKHAKASGHEFHTFSGTTRDFEHLAKHTKDGIFHSPAHISTTHSLNGARHFADNKHVDGGEEGEKHLMHIHVKPHDKVLHVSGHSQYSHEHETIIPAGTKLKYHGSSMHDNGLGDKYKAHHFTIHSQE